VAYVTVAALEAGTAQAGAGLLLRAPAPLAQSGEASRQLNQRLRTIADGTAKRLKAGAIQAYSRYPTLAGGFQAVTTTQGGRVVAGLAHTGKTVAGPDGPIPLIDLLDRDVEEHDIVPRDPSGWLVWHDAHGWHKAKQVHHPGHRGFALLPPLFAAEAARFEAAVIAAGLAVFDGL
jgi:hypothetical protein